VTFCVAVGNVLDTAGFSQPVVETFSNGAWSAAIGPVPGDTATDGGPHTPNAFLFSVDCTSTTSCVAVGRYNNASGNQLAMIDTLNGTTWSSLAAPLPSGALGDSAQLFGISCGSPSACTAVGYYNDTSHFSNGLLETLSGGSWTAMRAPEPSGAGSDGDTHQFANVTQVSCGSASACVGVGLYTDSTGTTQGLIESLNAGAWSVIQAPGPSDYSTGGDPGTVSCPTATWCTAVGFYSDTTNHLRGLIETLSGGTWTASTAPQPSNSAPPSSQYGYLAEIDCPVPGVCMAPGNYDDGSNVFRGMVDSYRGGVWSSMELPVPSNANVVSGNYSLARTVACDSPVACTVGGTYLDPGNTQGVLDTFTGSQGYWLDASDGGIFTYPNNTFYGSTGALKLNKPMVGMAATPDGQGYWLVASDGGIFSYGDALFHGSRGGQPLNKPIVGMATSPDGGGYWLVASDGGIFGYGDAGFFGSRGGQPINAPIVGMAATADGKGYWLVGSDGGIYSYGDALFYGSTGALKLNKPVVGMAATPTGLGYWLVASDGGIFNYGDAQFYGSTGSIVLNKPVVGMAGSPSGKGYWLVASDGGIFNYGDAPFQGSAGALHLNAPVVGMAGG
jgi:hypothetical protein